MGYKALSLVHSGIMLYNRTIIREDASNLCPQGMVIYVPPLVAAQAKNSASAELYG